MGVQVHLHAWVYDKRALSDELKAMLSSNTIYDRNMFRNPIGSGDPYIVKTRTSAQLVENLQQRELPILYEGLHCLAPAFTGVLSGHPHILRSHNIESDYYKFLARDANSALKKAYLNNEAELILKYEEKLSSLQLIAAISQNDTTHYNSRFGNAVYIPAFHPNETVSYNGNKEPFVLYHGNLSVPENAKAAEFLVKEVFDQNFPFQLVIAGNGAPRELRKAIDKQDNCRLEDQLTTEEIFELIGKAKINALPTFQSTGIKLKLLNVLYQGGYTLVNPKMVKGSGLESVCEMCNDVESFRNAISIFMKRKENPELIEARKQLLEEEFGNKKSAEKLIDEINRISS